MKSLLLFFMLFLLSGFTPSHQGFVDTCKEQHPKVFIIGQDLELESILNREYDYSIVSVFHEDVNTAFAEWTNMLLRMDQLCDIPEHDIRGIKAYATFYYARDGVLSYVGYALKSNSRFVRHSDMERYFARFMSSFKMPVPKSNQRKFSHSFTLTMPYPREISSPRPAFSHN